MYETGRLMDIGTADSLILGIAELGWDPDGSDFPQEFEFAFDAMGESVNA